MPPASSHDIAPVLPGEILDGKYRVDRILGAGGMGVVVLATHTELNQRVALKFLLPAALASPQIVERFAREARAAVRIQSEHVARVMDVGKLPTGSPYMVMEFLDGRDLAETLEHGGALPVEQAVGYVLQACEAIAEAHSLGIVHRDLKPANLFLARRASGDPVIKVLDFGISKTNEMGPSGLTQTSAVMGSPYYMAPEQMMSAKDVDARSDVWALGIILYELLAGAPPFVADTMPEIVFMVTQRDPPPLLTKRPDAPPALAEVVARCLRRDMTQRFPNVAKLAAALAPFGPPRAYISLERISRVLGASLPPAGVDRAAPGRMQATGSTWDNSHIGVKQGPKNHLAVVAVASAVVIAIGGGILWRSTRSSDRANAAAPSALPSTVPAPLSPAPVLVPGATVVDSRSAEPRASASAPVLPAPEPEVSSPPPTPLPVASAPSRPLPRPRPKPAAAAAPQKAAEPPAPASRGLNMGMKE